MTEKHQPNAIDPKSTPDETSFANLPNAVTDPQILIRMRKKRHLSGLMCPPVGALINTKLQQKDH